MREIKFRAKTVTADEWVFGHYAFVDGYHVIYENGRPIIIKSITLGQFTGLKDKNGKEIYEGDIICYNGGYTTSRAKMTVKWMDVGFVLEAYGELWAYSLGECITNTLEAIGNIYENPELLEESQNGIK